MKIVKQFIILSIILLGIPLYGGNIPLANSWYIQRASLVTYSGEQLSSNQGNLSNWYPCTVPSTVLAALVKNKVYTDIFFGKNLTTIPTQQFEEAWWYVTKFNLTPSKNKYYSLRFEGINYRANIWLNGKKIASADTLFGSFRIFDLEVSKVVSNKNMLAVEVFPPKPGDMTIGFVDWTPEPPDNNMGIWRPVLLNVSDAVSVENVFVDPKLISENKKAELIIQAELHNHTSHTQKVKLKGKLEKDVLEVDYLLKPFENKKIKLTSFEYPSLKIDSPKLWWPNNMGDANIYSLQLTAFVGKKLSSQVVTPFGVRDITQYWTSEGFRGFKINGKNILIMGAGFKDNLLLDDDSLTVEAKIQYVKHMNLNCIRVEGMWGNSDYLYKLCDKYGILVMAGFSCQWEWPHYFRKEFSDPDQNGGIISKEEMDLAVEYTHDQIVWLRNHPCLFTWIPGSDLLPRPELEKRYVETIKEVDPSLIYISAAAERTSTVAGATGIKMRGPYDFVTPNYWYVDSTKGGAFGFCSESGPGPQLPVLNTVKKMIPEKDLWPLDNEQWKFHCGRRHFETMEIFNHALEERYGKSNSIEEYVRKAQWMNYEAMKPTFESYRVNRNVATGLIHWMLNGAWPSTYWQLFDSYLIPNAAFYATRKACQPVSVAYNYKDEKLYLLNDSDKDYDSLQVELTVYSSHSHVVFSSTDTYSVHQYETKMLDGIPDMPDRNNLYFVFVKMKNKKGEVIADNYYWLSDKEDALAKETKKWFVTDNISFADFNYLNTLPKANVASSMKLLGNKDGTVEYEVSLENTSDKIAFNLELMLVDNHGEVIAPVLWEDNYISLRPGEKRILKVKYEKHFASNKKVNLAIQSKNLK